MLISVVIDTDITAGSNADVDIGVSLPLEGVKGIVSVQDLNGTTAQPSPEKYTVKVVNDHTVNIAIAGTGADGGTDLTFGDVVNIVAILEGEIARP